MLSAGRSSSGTGMAPTTASRCPGSSARGCYVGDGRWSSGRPSPSITPGSERADYEESGKTVGAEVGEAGGDRGRRGWPERAGPVSGAWRLRSSRAPDGAAAPLAQGAAAEEEGSGSLSDYLVAGFAGCRPQMARPLTGSGAVICCGSRRGGTGWGRPNIRVVGEDVRVVGEGGRSCCRRGVGRDGAPHNNHRVGRGNDAGGVLVRLAQRALRPGQGHRHHGSCRPPRRPRRYQRVRR